MLKNAYRNYWRFGFRSRLYDLLTPQSYLDSIENCVRALDLKEGERVLDAGCGSGLGLLSIIRHQSRARYVGTDFLESGLSAGRAKAVRCLEGRPGLWVRSDLSRGLPFRNEAFQKILAHFSVYTLAEKDKRVRAWESLHRVLSPGGTLAAANPSADYNSRQIIEESLRHPGLSNSTLKFWEKRLLYFFTERLGLRHIESQLRAGYWHAYFEGELEEELRAAGFRVSHSQAVYAGSGWMVLAEKP